MFGRVAENPRVCVKARAENTRVGGIIRIAIRPSLPRG